MRTTLSIDDDVMMELDDRAFFSLAEGTVATGVQTRTLERAIPIKYPSICGWESC